MDLNSMSVRSVEGPHTEQTWDFTSADANWMLDYWNSLRGNNARPKWSDIDLMAVYQYARAMTVKDAIDDGKDFFVRFWGAELTEFLQYEATGKKLSEYYPERTVESALETHRLALFGDKPVRRWGDSQFPNRGLAKFEMIHLPLDNDAGERAHIITLTTFAWSPN
jgi:hypothetical protein